MGHEVVEGTRQPHPAGDRWVLVPWRFFTRCIVTIVIYGQQNKVGYCEEEPYKGEHVGSYPAGADL